MKPNQKSNLPLQRLSELKQLASNFGLQFQNYSILDEAFTHKSYSNENPETKFNNERLEFLGDSVLGLVISKNLFLKFKQSTEGELSKSKSEIVSGKSLSKVCEEMEIIKYLKLGRGEIQNKGNLNPSTLENLFEAFIGAIYLDLGFEVAENLILNLFEMKQAPKKSKDYSSILQEYTQKKFQSLPIYTLITESGPDHEKKFRIKVEIETMQFEYGEGSSKQKAKLDSAKNLLIKLRKI